MSRPVVGRRGLGLFPLHQGSRVPCKFCVRKGRVRRGCRVISLSSGRFSASNDPLLASCSARKGRPVLFFALGRELGRGGGRSKTEARGDLGRARWLLRRRRWWCWDRPCAESARNCCGRGAGARVLQRWRRGRTCSTGSATLGRRTTRTGGGHWRALGSVRSSQQASSGMVVSLREARLAMWASDAGGKVRI
jgi:hypothetical protein